MMQYFFSQYNAADCKLFDPGPINYWTFHSSGYLYFHYFLSKGNGFLAHIRARKAVTQSSQRGT